MKPIPVALTYALPPAAVSIPRRILGLAFLMICLTASGMLVLQHFGKVSLPGCGPLSGCAAAVDSQWGNLLGWPVSFLGLAYFAALTVAWTCTTGSGVSMLLRATIRLAALVSVAHLLILSIERWGCMYCVVIHIANLVFWIIVERSQRSTELTPASIVTVLAGFALVTSLLNVFITEQAHWAAEQAGRESYRSFDVAELDSFEDVLSHDATDPSFVRTDPDPDPSSIPDPESESESVLVGADAETDRDGSRSDASEQQASLADQRDVQATRQPYRTGSDQAKVNLVVFYDYQSSQCWRIERDIQNLLGKYGDRMSVTARHYPLCSDCNVSLSSNSHPNSCRAAFAAEAAGLLKGNDGFWQMHRWLLQNQGNFSDKELKQGLVELGYEDTNQFLETMNSPLVLGGVLADIVEAQSLGVRTTPTVYFNGDRLAGLQAGTGLIDALLAVVERKKTSPMEVTQDPRNSPIDLSAIDEFSEELQTSSLAATVRIVNTAGTSVGSGAIVALREPSVYVLTASHIVGDSQRVEVHTYSEQSYPKPAGVYSHATVVANSASSDLAVIRFSTREPMPKPLSIVPLERVAEMIEPQKSRLPVLTIGYDGQASAPSCIVTAVIGSKAVRRNTGDVPVMVWEVARESARGRSGGPLIDQRGFVLGIASGIAEGKAYSAHAEEIHRFLTRNGLHGLLAPVQQR